MQDQAADTVAADAYMKIRDELEGEISDLESQLAEANARADAAEAKLAGTPVTKAAPRALGGEPQREMGPIEKAWSQLSIAKKPINHQDLAKYFDKIATKIKALRNRVDALEAENAQLKKTASSQQSLRYRGTWSSGENYSPGTFITCKGSLWHCEHNDPGRPGDPNSGWRLAVKRGRDGRPSKGGHDDDRD